MRKRELLKRIEELEARVRELEQQPVWAQPYYVPQSPTIPNTIPQGAWWGVIPPSTSVPEVVHVPTVWTLPLGNNPTTTITTC